MEPGQGGNDLGGTARRPDQGGEAPSGPDSGDQQFQMRLQMRVLHIRPDLVLIYRKPDDDAL